MKDVEKLEPRAFTKFCMSIGAVPSSYLAGLTIEEQLLWLCSYLEKEVIPAVNNNGEAVSELQALYIELHDYVEHYFDNLDVQEEINNKLDAMVEDGTLTTIIAQYFNTQKIYNTFDAMVEDSENLIEGLNIKTLGYHNINDGGSANYVITSNNETNDYYISVDDTFYAKLILDGSELNVKTIGAFGDDTHEDTEIFQDAIDFCSDNNFTLKIPNGEYLIANLVLKPYIRIIGEINTRIKTLNSPNISVFKLQRGPVTNYLYDYEINGLYIEANENVGNQRIFDFDALKTLNNEGGGLWHATIKNIRIPNLTGNQVGIYLNADDNVQGVDVANQYLRFENVNIYRNSNNSTDVYIRGQIGQTVFENCEFNGRTNSITGYNVYFEDTTHANDNAFMPMLFKNVTFQTCQNALYLDKANVTLECCHFEQVTNHTITTTNSSYLNLINTNFSSGINKPIKVGTNTYIHGFGNTWTAPQGVLFDTSDASYYQIDVEFNGTIESLNDAKPSFSTSSITINCYYKHIFIDNNYSSDIQVIKSPFDIGSIITITNTGTNTHNILNHDFSTNSNLYWDTNTFGNGIRLAENGTIQFIKTSVNTYSLIKLDNIKAINTYSGNGLSFNAVGKYIVLGDTFTGDIQRILNFNINTNDLMVIKNESGASVNICNHDFTASSNLYWDTTTRGSSFAIANNESVIFIKSSNTSVGTYQLIGKFI